MSLLFNNHGSRGKEDWFLIPVLLVGLLQGIIYLRLIPPWQHYDEPTHFEYAWLIANRGHLPTSGEYDQNMRREVAASMVEFHFFDNLSIRPNLVSITEPIWIGISQINSRPVYYLLEALPLWLVRSSDITFQLYLTRCTSLVFYLITIVAVIGITRRLFPAYPMRWMVPVTLVMLPGFTELMTAVNDDVGATALFSLFLWSSILTIQNGLTWRRLSALAVTAALCFWTKNTVTFAVFLLVIPVTFGALKGDKRRWAWGLLSCSILVFLVATFAWGDAADWYRQSFPDNPSRTEAPQASSGSYTFQIPLQENTSAPRLRQVLAPSQSEALRGKTVSLGAWIWASQEASVYTPSLYTPSNNHSNYQTVNVNTQPTFFAFRVTLPQDTEKMQVILSPVSQGEKRANPVTVYYDGIVLAEGEYPLEKLPQFSDSSGTQGQWGSQPFINLLRNPSAETGWFRVRNWADDLIGNNTPVRPSLVLGTLRPATPAMWYYRDAFEFQAQTFWARFSWGQITLLSFHPYLILGLVTLAGLAGAVFYGINAIWKRGWRSLPWEYLFFLGLTFLFLWCGALARGISSVINQATFIPPARYAYPAILPTLIILCLGWLEYDKLVKHLPPIFHKIPLLAYLLFFIGLNILSWISITNYYHTIHL